MPDDVRAAEQAAKANRIQDQFRAWQQWRVSLGKSPEDWAAFRRDLAAAGTVQEGGPSVLIGVREGNRTVWIDPSRGAVRASPRKPQRGKKSPRGATDPLAAALARGEQMQRDILATQGALLSADEVAARLQIEPAEVEWRAQEGMLLGLALESGETGFPSWQFTDDGLLPGLEMALRSLSVRNSWMRAAFFLSGDLRLDGRTPLEALLRGEIDAVSAAGAAYGEQVAS